jgi:hypothetical protein
VISECPRGADERDGFISGISTAAGLICKELISKGFEQGVSAAHSQLGRFGGSLPAEQNCHCGRGTGAGRQDLTLRRAPRQPWAWLAKGVCDYVHLNPVRAGMLRPEQRWESYRWSSYPLSLREPAGRPPGLPVDRLPGEWGLPGDSAAGRQQVAAQMEARRLAEQTGDFTLLPAGWCRGSEEFRRELLLQMSDLRLEVWRAGVAGDERKEGSAHPGGGTGSASLEPGYTAPNAQG